MVDTLERLTKLVALHGVYAILVIYIFFQQRSAYANLKAATKEKDRQYFRRIHATIVGVTVIMSFVAIPMWWTATFSFAPPVTGVLQEISEQPLEPKALTDEPQDLEELVPDDGSVPFYSRLNEIQPGSGKYELSWAIPKFQADRMRFSFRHTRRVFEHQPLDEPTVRRPGAGKLTTIGPLISTFSLNLASVGSPAHPIELKYVHHETAPHDSLGMMTVLRGDNFEVVPWDPVVVKPAPATTPAPRAPGQPARDDHASAGGWSLGVVARAFAQSVTGKNLFAADGTFDPRVGASLRAQLGGRDVASQLSARNLVVSNGPRAVAFIRASAADAASRTGEDRVTLLQNLAVALSDIERSNRVSYPDVTHSLALALYHSGGFAAAANLFATLGDSSMRPEDWYYRGYAQYSSGQSQAAIASLNSYLRVARSSDAQSATHALIGLVYEGLNQPQEAITHYRRALELVPSNSMAANNLAYQYAVQGEQLPYALRLVDQALAGEPANPHFLDTKGWVLYRQGKVDEALRLIEEAVKVEPYNHEIVAHRDMLRKLSAEREGRRTP